MPARLWWIATAFVSFVFAVSLLTETAGLTTFCGLNAVVGVSLLAIPSVITASCAAVATYREHTSRIAGEGEMPLGSALDLFGSRVA